MRMCEQPKQLICWRRVLPAWEYYRHLECRTDVLPIGHASGDAAEDRGTNMKATFDGKSRAALLVGLAGLLLFIAPRARADEGDPPSRVARISYLEGNVPFQPSGTADWAAAGKKRPATVGQHLSTVQDPPHSPPPHPPS